MRIIVVGADGVIGAALVAELAHRGHTVIGTTRRRSTPAVFLDLSDPENMSALPDAEVAVICAAMARFADCRNQPELARNVNVVSPTKLAQQLIGRGTRVIRLSSSAVFDCQRPNVAAGFPTAPRSAYGRLQAEAEKSILALGPMSTIFRLTKIMTAEFALMANWTRSLQQGETVQAFKDHTLCPLSLRDGVEALAAVVEHGTGGIYQVSGAGDISYFELGQYLAGRLGAAKDHVVPILAKEKNVPPEEITPYTSMDTSRLTTLTGFVPPEPFDVIGDVFGSAIDAARRSK